MYNDGGTEVVVDDDSDDYDDDGVAAVATFDENCYRGNYR